MDKERVSEIDKPEQEEAGSMDIAIKIRKPYLGSPDCPLPVLTTIDHVGNSYRISAPDIDTAVEAITDIRDRENKEPINHRPAAMAAIKAVLEAEIRKCEAGMGKRWYAEIGDEVKKLLPIIIAAPALLEAAKIISKSYYESAEGDIGYGDIERLDTAIKQAEGA